MKNRTRGGVTISCRQARKQFSRLSEDATGEGRSSAERPVLEPSVLERHVQSCERCSREYRIFAFTQVVLDRAGADHPVEPGEDFFIALRARINRGPGWASRFGISSGADEPWASVVMVAARQLIPIMAVLLLLIIGASLLWSAATPRNGEMAIRPSERVIFNDVYDLSRPTPDDVLETLVAVEETENGK